MDYNKYFEHPKWTKKDSVEVAIKCAELALPIFEKENTNDDRPRKAIEAAKAWLEDPTARAAHAVAHAALNASRAATCAASDAAAHAADAASKALFSSRAATCAASDAACAAEDAGVPKTLIEAVFEAQLTKLK